MRAKRFLVALSLAGIAVGGLTVGPVGAQSNVHETGMVGPWHLNDDGTTPGANCIYGKEYAPDYAGLRSMKAWAPIVYAADRNSAVRDHKTVKWYWRLQRAHSGDPHWQTIRTSDVQTATAYEDQTAPFTPMRINHNVGNPDINDVIYRAKVFIKWVKADGTVEGAANATVDFYKLKEFGYSAVGGQPYCAEVTTAG